MDGLGNFVRGGGVSSLGDNGGVCGCGLRPRLSSLAGYHRKECDVGGAIMPTVHGILETALYVADVRRAAEFYRRVIEFDVLVESDRLAALDVVGRNVLLLFKVGG